MKYNRILTTALTCSAMAGLFVGCYEDYDDYQVGPQNKSLHVAFVNDGELRVDKTATELSLTLVRSTDPAADHSALEVPIIVNEMGADFKVPASAKFEAGKDTTEIVVALPEEIEFNNPYFFNISLPEQYYATYDEYTKNAFMLTTTITKEDYVKYADATFLDYFWGATEEGPAEKEILVEYSPMLDTYRVRSLFESGYHFFFKWNQETNKVTLVNASGKAVTSWSSGLSYGSYGAITCVIKADTPAPAFDPEDNSLEFTFDWQVSVGSFGTCPIYILF